MLDIVILGGIVLLCIVLFFILNAVAVSRLKADKTLKFMPYVVLPLLAVFVITGAVLPNVLRNNVSFADVDSCLLWTSNPGAIKFYEVDKKCEFDDGFVCLSNNNIIFVSESDGKFANKKLASGGQKAEEENYKVSFYGYTVNKTDTIIIVSMYTAEEEDEEFTVNGQPAQLFAAGEKDKDGKIVYQVVNVLTKAESYTVTHNGEEKIIKLS